MQCNPLEKGFSENFFLAITGCKFTSKMYAKTHSSRNQYYLLSSYATVHQTPYAAPKRSTYSPSVPAYRQAFRPPNFIGFSLHLYVPAVSHHNVSVIRIFRAGLRHSGALSTWQSRCPPRGWDLGRDAVAHPQHGGLGLCVFFGIFASWNVCFAVASSQH